MKRISRRWWRASEAGTLALAVALAGCGGSSAPTARPGTLSARRHPAEPAHRTRCAELPPTDAPRVCAVAALDPEAGAIEVRLVIPPEVLPEDRAEVQLRFRERCFGERYAEDFVEPLSHDAWPATLGAARATVELRYRVRLDSREGGAPGARGGLSWRRPGGWHLTGQSFLPDVWVDGEAVEVPATLLLETGDRPLWTAAGRDTRLFDAESLTRLADEAYEVGPLTTTRREAGDTTLLIGTSEEAGEARLEALADVVARAFEILDDVLGPPQADAILYAYHPIEGDERWAERLGASLVQVGPGLPADPLYGQGAVTLRELAHLWNPGRHVLVEDWLEEGVTDYLAVKVAATLSGATARQTARVILRRHRAYAANADGRTAGEPSPGDAPWPTDGGLVAAYCLDTHLQRAGGSLEVALRSVLGRGEETLDAEDLLEELAAIAPTSASYLAALLSTRDAFAIDDCLERAGWSLREVTFDGASDHSLAVDVLGAPALRSHAHTQSMEVETAADGSALETGDVLRRVHGHPVAELLDVAWALRDVPPGEPFEVELRRAGEARAVELTLPEDLSRAPRDYLELVATEGTR
ncbi:MAG TPA: hypothetical protein RMH99_14660 [Sandaracinaceae bacterium LLY-WYZ-13_1]|nr:hypothetical protein [Sandaracinaceae bacterium LLY-WYZ-13_1]